MTIKDPGTHPYGQQSQPSYGEQRQYLPPTGYGSWFSCSDLLQQLDSPDGNQFTHAQVANEVQAVGLGSC